MIASQRCVRPAVVTSSVSEDLAHRMHTTWDQVCVGDCQVGDDSRSPSVLCASSRLAIITVS